MEVEKIAPVVSSPLDFSRGRGNARIIPPKKRRENGKRNTSDDAPLMLIVLPETLYSLGLTNVKQ